MSNVLPLIVIIFAVVALIIVVGFIIGTVAHNMKAETEKVTDQPKVEKHQETLQPEFEELFSLQIMASSKYDNLKDLQEKLQTAKYDTEISKLMREGSIIYRLRLKGLYNEHDAIELGEELKNKYKSIESYWLEEQQTRLAKTKNNNVEIKDRTRPISSSASVQQKINTGYEEDIEITKQKVDFGTECEVQILASSVYSKIEKVKTDLEELGYNTKIQTFTQGDKIIYRLRLRGLYEVEEGKRLGNEVVKTSPAISAFWLDKIVDGESVGQISSTEKPDKASSNPITTTPSSEGDYEVQILANAKRNFVEDKKNILENAGFNAKIVTTNKDGKIFYRLRLLKSYSRDKATQIGNKLKKEVDFVKDYWIVPKSTVTKSSFKPVKPKVQIEDKSLTEPIQYSMNPKYNPKEKSAQKTMTCTSNDINIRIGPGTYYAVDPIGKLMKGVTVFIVEEREDWVKFTITPNDDSWSGWVHKKYLK
ncbi:MAG: SH3 domain-containing protein [Candidatus Cloacimonetes bacterium]|nr:SH3 domain-containing protein [Candidatus Cloacimonadota bacterium]